MAKVNQIRKVLMTADTIGGVWTYALDLARGLNDYDVEVSVATMGAPLSPQQSKEAAAVPNLQIHESTFKLEWMQDAWTDVERAGEWLLQLATDLKPNVIHLNGFAHGNLPWRVPKLVVGHSCVLSWWKAVKGEPAPDQWTPYRFAVTKGVRAADLVVAPTRAMLAELQRYYGPFRATAVIANGRCSKSYRATRKEPVVLAAGRLWDEAKNIAALARAAAAMEWPVYVAGDDRHPDGKMVSYQNLRSLGKLTANALAAWYSRAAIYCLPAKYEPFGLSVLEAALSGCALVLGDIPSLRENWDGAAVFVAPGDARALEWHLRGLIENRKRLDSLAAAAQQRAQRFTVRRAADSYLSAYTQLSRKPIARAIAGD